MKNRTHIFATILVGVTCLALLPMAQAVVPAPDGGYPGGNTAEGQAALLSRTTGIYNTGVGLYSLLSLTDGNFCTGVGAGALLANTADGNTAIGAGALLTNTNGQGNTADGEFALFNNNGFNNTATGAGALQNNTTADSNTANGSGALFSNTEGENNTATGSAALLLNTTGSRNTATGAQALFLNTADDNTAYGYKALDSNAGGFFNTAVGDEALQTNMGGGGNTAVGYFALHNSTGGGNIAIGVGAGTNLTAGNNNIYVGNVGAPGGESNTTRIGIAKTTQNTFIDGIHGATIDPATALAVGVDASGKLGTTVSSRRFKHDIKPMDKASEAIIALKPVTFRYKSDAKDTPQFGSIAEEGDQVNPDLAVHDKNGEILSVHYDQINAMLLNEFLKEHRKVQEQEATIGRLGTAAAKQDATTAELKSTVVQQQKGMEALTAQLKDQAAQIEKVSAQTVRYDQVNAMLLNEFLKEHKKVEEQQSTITQLKNNFQVASAEQQKEIELLTAQVKEQAAQIQKVSAQIEVSRSTPQVVTNKP